MAEEHQLRILAHSTQLRVGNQHSDVDHESSPISTLLDRASSEAGEHQEAHSDSASFTQIFSGRPQKRSSTFSVWQNLTNKYWIYEVTSCLISLLALAALFTVLGTFNGRALPDWPNYISINTIVAITTAVLKASLMLPITECISELKWQWFKSPKPLIDISAFDAASRGPWGSCLLLFSRKHRSLVTLGAAITVCALAIDSFSQQVLRYQNCFIPVTSETAQISRTNNYSTSGYHTGAGTTALDSVMSLSIYTGLLSSPENASSLVSTSCPSGNCTFKSDNGASYSSIAICQKSQDISQYIQNRSDSKSIWNYTLPSGLDLSGGSVLSSTTLDYGKEIEYYGKEDLSDVVFAFEALMYGSGSFVSNDPRVVKPFAVRSSIYPCIKTWGANITFSELTGIEVTNILMKYNTEGVFTHVATRTLRSGTWQDCDPTSQMTEYNTVSVAKDRHTSNTSFFDEGVPNGTILWYPPDCIWLFGRESIWGIQGFLGGLYYQKYLGSPYGPAPYGVGDLWLQDLYVNATANMTTVNRYMDGLANSMTATVRSRGDPPPAPYTNYASGTVLGNQICIEVEWKWLVLPASLVFCSIVFLAATIITTSPQLRDSGSANALSLSKADPRKSSPLPLLFCGLESNTLQKVGHPSSWVDMHRTAETLHVRQGRSMVDGNWYLLHEKKNQ